MHLIKLTTTVSGKSEWIEVPHEDSDICNFAQKLLREAGNIPGDGWVINDLDGYTFFEPENHCLDPDSIVTLSNLTQEYGLAAEVFAEEFGLFNLAEYFEYCFVGEFYDLRHFARCARNRGLLRKYNLTDRTRLESKALELSKMLDLTIFSRDTIFVFEDTDPVINDYFERPLDSLIGDKHELLKAIYSIN